MSSDFGSNVAVANLCIASRYSIPESFISVCIEMLSSGGTFMS